MKKQKKTDSQIQRIDWWLTEGKGVGDWVKEVKRLRSTNWKLLNSYKEIKYIIGNIVNTIVITIYGARRALDLSGEITFKIT